MFDRRFNGQSRTAGRNRLQQEAVHLAAVDQVHQHLAVVTPAGNDVHEPRGLLGQMRSEFLDVRSDHRRVDDSDANLMFGERLLGLGERVGGAHVVHASRRLLDCLEELLVFGHDEYVDCMRTRHGGRGDLLRVQGRHPAGSIADDRRAVLRRLHDDVLGVRLVGSSGRVIRGLSERHQTHLTGRVVDELAEVVGSNGTAAHDLEDFLLADQCFETFVVVAGQQRCARAARTSSTDAQ